MPQFNRQRVRLSGPSQLPQRTNVLGAVGAGLSKIGAAVDRRDQLEAEDQRKTDIAQAQHDSLARQQAMLQGDQDAKAQVQAGGELKGFMEGGRKRREDYNNEWLKDKSPAYIDAYHKATNNDDINSMGRDATFMGSTRLKRSKDAVDNSSKALSLNTDLSVDGVFGSAQTIMDAGTEIGVDPKYTSEVLTPRVKDNLRTQITAPGNEDKGKKILEDPRVQELFTDIEIESMEFIIQENTFDSHARFETEMRGNAISASTATYEMARDDGDYHQVMSVLSNTELKPIQRVYMEGQIRKWYGITKTDNKDPDASVAFIDDSFKKLVLDHDSELRAIIKNDKLNSKEKAEAIDLILDKTSKAMDEARLLHRKGEISQDVFNKKLIDYNEITTFGMDAMSPDTKTGFLSIPGRIIGGISRFVFGEPPPGISALTNTEIENIDSNKGIYKDITEQEKAILKTSLRDSIIKNNDLDEAITPEEAQAAVDAAIADANKDMEKFKYPGVPPEKIERIKEAEQNRASTPSTIRPTDSEIQFHLGNPNNSDDAMIDWMESRDMTPDEIGNLIENRVSTEPEAPEAPDNSLFTGPPTPSTQSLFKENTPNIGDTGKGKISGIGTNKRIDVTVQSSDPETQQVHDVLMDKIVAKLPDGVTREDFEKLMSDIILHESKGVKDSKQDSGGPGRGLFQYELASGKGSGAGRVAMQRLFNTVGEEGLPGWAEKFFTNGVVKGDVDFSTLTMEQQIILFLADKLQDPTKTKGGFNLEQIGVLSNADWWAEFHHKGKDSDTDRFIRERG